VVSSDFVDRMERFPDWPKNKKLKVEFFQTCGCKGI